MFLVYLNQNLYLGQKLPISLNISPPLSNSHSTDSFFKSFIGSMNPVVMPSTGHIGFGLCVRSRTMHARVLKFQIWIPYGKIFDTRFFFLVRVVSLSGVMPL